jgi:hypothetical protein
LVYSSLCKPTSPWAWAQTRTLAKLLKNRHKACKLFTRNSKNLVKFKPKKYCFLNIFALILSDKAICTDSKTVDFILGINLFALNYNAVDRAVRKLLDDIRAN